MPMDNGLVVEVLRSVDNIGGWEHYGPCWEVKSLGSGFHMTPSTMSQIASIPDRYLRRIDNPGPDAVDETLEWLNVPTKEGQPA